MRTIPTPPHLSLLGRVQKRNEEYDASSYQSKAANTDLDQTANVGTVRYMAPEVGGRGNEAESPSSSGKRYSVQVDVFSVGMVFYFVIEGKPPSVEGASNAEAHFAALAAGARPVYSRANSHQKRVIDLCLRQLPSQRPTSRELISLVNALPEKRFLCFTAAVSTEREVEASKALASIETRAKA